MIRFGSLELKSNLFLSPLAGYTNLPFRLAVREVGGLDLATTDLVNARSLLEKNPKAFKLIETCPADRPLAVQLFGSVPEEMRDAALMLEARGISSIDINMGCPVKKVCRVGGGSAMMTELDKTAALVRGMVDARENSRDGEDAPGLGRREHHRARSGARAGRCRRGRDFRSRPHARAGFRRLGESRWHSQSRGSGAVAFPSSATAT